MKAIPATILLALALILQGCGSTPKETAYKTLSVIGASVDVAMKAAADAKVAGKISDSEWTQIAAKHEDFRVAYVAACRAAGLDYSQLAPETVAALQTELLTLINQFSR